MARTSHPLAFLALAAAIAAWAHDVPQSPQIRVSTRLVQLGVIARDKDGLVQDLTKDDFIVLDQGKSRQISVFSVESGKSTAIPQLAKLLPPNTFSDLPQYGAGKPRSVTIVLLDNLNTLYGSAPESKYEAVALLGRGPCFAKGEDAPDRIHQDARSAGSRGHLRASRFAARVVRLHERPRPTPGNPK